MVTAKRQAWVLSILAIGFLVIAALLMAARISEAEDANGQMVSVLVAKADIPAHSTLTRDMITTTTIPVRFVTGNILKQEADIEHKTTVTALKKGDLMTSNLLRSVSELDQSLRAFSLLASGKVLIEPTIRPGDRIDVMGAYHDRAANTDIATVIVPDVEVISVNSQTKDLVVTLSLRVDQAEAIMRVENFGQQLRLVKRGA